MAEFIAQRVNDACSKRAMEPNLKDLYEKYNTPANCKYFCVPKVNLELRHDLCKEPKSKDLNLRELPKGIAKGSQPILQLFDSALKARKDKSLMDPDVLLPLLTDAVTFLGHASFLASLKRREFLNQRSLSLISLFVIGLTQLQLVCLGMNCPSILMRLERSIRYQERCLAVRRQSGIWSVLTREVLMHLVGATHGGLTESPLF